MHVHVFSPAGEAKFWIEPEIEFDRSRGLGQREIRAAEQIIRDNVDEIVLAWRNHFGS